MLHGNNINNINPISVLVALSYLSLSNNYISDISPLSGLTELTYLNISKNNIFDIQVLIDNNGINNNDLINLSKNPLNSYSIDVLIPILQGRGVTIDF